MLSSWALPQQWQRQTGRWQLFRVSSAPAEGPFPLLSWLLHFNNPHTDQHDGGFPEATVVSSRMRSLFLWCFGHWTELGWTDSFSKLLGSAVVSVGVFQGMLDPLLPWEIDQEVVVRRCLEWMQGHQVYKPWADLDWLPVALSLLSVFFEVSSLDFFFFLGYALVCFTS